MWNFYQNFSFTPSSGGKLKAISTLLQMKFKRKTFDFHDMNRKFFFWVGPIGRVIFRWTPPRSTHKMVYFWKFKSRFLHLKSHFWTGLWTENSRKILDVHLTSICQTSHFLSNSAQYNSRNYYFSKWKVPRSRFFDFKLYSWSEVLTKNSKKKKSQMFLYVASIAGVSFKCFHWFHSE